MVLDHSGPALGMILYGAAMKLLVLGALITGVAAPLATVDPWIAWGAVIAALVALSVAIGVVESVMARLRLTQVPNLLVAACLFSAFGAILLVR